MGAGLAVFALFLVAGACFIFARGQRADKTAVRAAEVVSQDKEEEEEGAGGGEAKSESDDESEGKGKANQIVPAAAAASSSRRATQNTHRGTGFSISSHQRLRGTGISRRNSGVKSRKLSSQNALRLTGMSRKVSQNGLLGMSLMMTQDNLKATGRSTSHGGAMLSTAGRITNVQGEFLSDRLTRLRSTCSNLKLTPPDRTRPDPTQ